MNPLLRALWDDFCYEAAVAEGNLDLAAEAARANPSDDTHKQAYQAARDLLRVVDGWEGLVPAEIPTWLSWEKYELWRAALAYARFSRMIELIGWEWVDGDQLVMATKAAIVIGAFPDTKLNNT